MAHLPPPSAPAGNPVAAVIAGLAAFGLIVYGFLAWLWPLGDFGPWHLHWPYLKDGLMNFFHFPGTGRAWWEYHQALAQDGHLAGLYGRLVVLAASGLTASLWVAFRTYAQSKPADVHVRGLQYIRNTRQALKLARREAKRERRRDSTTGVKIHPRIQISAGRENLGFLAIGAMGSGKTQFLLPILLQAIKKHRTVIFDYKGEYTEVLPIDDQGMVLIAPWDRRSAQWDIAADVTTRSDARLIAEMMIHDSHDPMWSNAARQVLTGLIYYLCRTKPGWSFVDLAALISASNDRLAEVIRQGNPEVLRIVENLAADGKTAQSILLNMTAYLSPITDLADAWEEDRDVFSIRHWLADGYQGPRVLVLQGSSRYESLMQAVIKALLAVLVSRVIDPSFPEARFRQEDYRLFFFLDEFPRLGRITELEKLIAVGRSKGARLLLGFQDIGQVRDLYGQEVAAAWFSQLATQFYGRVAPGDTANWISEVLGKSEVYHPTRTLSASRQDTGLYSSGQAGMSETIGWQPMEKPLILPSQLATELNANSRGVTALLQCTGWPHLYRLTWPITTLKSVRSASLPAAWTGASVSPGGQSSTTDEAADEADATAPGSTDSERARRPWRRTSTRTRTAQEQESSYELDGFF